MGDTQRIAAIVLIAGSLLFFVGATMNAQVFMVSAPDVRLQLMQNDLTGWQIGQLFFGLGSSVAAVGIALALGYLGTHGAARWTAAGAVLAIAGVIVWDGHVWLRAFNPADFANGSLPGWLYPVYALFTLAALILLGIALLQVGFPAWVGIVSIGYPLLLLAAYLVFRDLPPFTIYFLALGIGIVLIM